VRVLTFEQFVELVAEKSWGRANTWVYEPGLALYVRKPLLGVRPPGIDFDLASMEADAPGRGALTAFLDRHEPKYGFYVENLLNPRLIGYLERRGYRRFARHVGQLDVHMVRERGRGSCDSSASCGAGSAGTDSA
jgi:hypothetical protein